MHFSITPRERTVTSGFLSSFSVGGKRAVEFEEIKPPNFVGAVVRTIARADAAIVNLQIQSFVVVHGRADGTNEFARRVFAMHARHRLMIELRLVRRPGIIVVDANPMHLAARAHLVFADDRNVIFGLAGNRAGIAADAGVEIDHHAPGVAGILEFIGIVERFVVLRHFRLFARKIADR